MKYMRSSGHNPSFYMKKYFVATFLSFPSVLFGQSAYLHEALEDAESSGQPITFGGIIVFAIIVGIIYLVVKKIDAASTKSEKKKFDRKYEDTKRRQATIEEGGFVCPICGEHVHDKNFETMWQIIEGNSCTIKLCKNCGDSYYRYSKRYSEYKRKEKKGMPDWVCILVIVLLIALGLYTFIMGCITGEILMGIIGLFFTPIVIGMPLLLIIYYLFEFLGNPKPSKPFELPSLSHLRECNAIITKNRIKGIN